MLEIIKEQFLLNQTQTIVLNKKGIVCESDNQLFIIDSQTQIQDFHPFFEIGIVDLLKKPNYTETFYCIHIQLPTRNGIYDVYLNSGNETFSPFLIIYDFTDRYLAFQVVAQEKNLSLLSFREETLKNQKLQIEKEFKNKFLANVTHDLRTPIASVLGFIEIIQQTQLTTDQINILKTIHNTGSHLNDLVEDLVDLANIEAGQFAFRNKSFDFYDFVYQIEKTYNIKSAQKNIDFILNIDNKIPRYIVADRTRLFQLITNIMDNAVKFTQNGSIVLTMKENYRRADNVGLQIQATDTGIGFSAKNRSKIFESFTKLHTDDFGGLGLGLSIVKEITTRLGGTVKIKSVLKQGTTIEINVPLKIDMETSSKAKKVVVKEFLASDFKNKFKILVVDDNEVNQLLLLKMISDHGGFFIDITDSAEQALTVVENEAYDLILMDVNMPEMSGIDGVKIIKNNLKLKIAKTPIIILSAKPSAKERQECKSLGVKEYISRPHTREELFLAMYKALRVKKVF